MKRSMMQSLVLTGLFLSTISAAAETLLLDPYSHGTVMNTQISGVTISGVNIGGGPDLIAIFDTNLRGTNDPDLEGPKGDGTKNWAGGNIGNTTDVGNVLIIQENGSNTDTTVDPDDEGSDPAGFIIFEYDSLRENFQFVLLDVETNEFDSVNLTGVSGVPFTPSDVTNVLPGVFFLLNDVIIDSFAFEELVGEAGFAFGDRKVNRLNPILTAGAYDTAIIFMGGSGAVTEVSSDPAQSSIPPIPAPAALPAGLIMLGIMAIRRRRALS